MKDDAGFADKMNSMPKYVVSTTLTDPAWSNTTVLPDVDAVAELKQREGDILVAGSAQLHHGLVERGLVDEWRLMVFPIVLGSGKRLFGETAGATGLELVDSRPLASGSLYLTYRRAASVAGCLFLPRRPPPPRGGAAGPPAAIRGALRELRPRPRERAPFARCG